MILVSIIFPVLMGAFILLVPEKGFFSKRNNVFMVALATQVVGCVLAFFAITMGRNKLVLFNLTEDLPISFVTDMTGNFFAVVVSIVWLLCLVFSYEYMKHEEKNKRYFGFYVLVYGILLGLDFAGNIITFYMFYELMTILSVPLVLHSQTKEAIMAGLKYMFYSFAGAYMVIFGLFFTCKLVGVKDFAAGGYLDLSLIRDNKILLVSVFMMILGFSVKAGMFPMHAWLPTAHPVAPAPASAALSGIIVKSGVLGIIRTVFFVFGPEFVKGTWAQTVWMVLSLTTVFMGSMLAYREDVLKKRLAYSTVSQLSYILFGLSLLNPTAYEGALLHVFFHAFAKAGLFLAAGAIIYKTHIVKASQLKGIGKKMPVTIWCFAIAALSLIGIPPTGGFLSKWSLCVGALQEELPGFSIIGPAILLISALLTAGYLLPVVVKGFLPGEDYDYENHVNLEKQKSIWWMLVPLLVLAVLSVLPSLFSKSLTGYIGYLSEAVFMKGGL